MNEKENFRIEYAATNSIKEVLNELHAALCGLDADTVSLNRSKYGNNRNSYG